MRVPILTGLLLASAWTACAQSDQSGPMSDPSSIISNNIITETATTPSPTTSTDVEFEFVAFPGDGAERVYIQSNGPPAVIRIHMPAPSEENIELYVRKSDGDNAADKVMVANASVATTSVSEERLISVTSVVTITGENVQDITLNFNNILASEGDGHAFFLVIQANPDSGRPGMSGGGLEVVATSPLFAIIKDGNSDRSGFQDEDLSSSEPAEIGNDSPPGPSKTSSKDVLNPTVATSSSSKGKNSGGLATGAIAGIAVGAAVVLIIVVAAIWFILRRRRKQRVGSHPTDVSTPLAAGYGGAAGASSREFMGDKEAGAMVAESPQSQAYTDQPDPRHSTLSGAAIIGGATAAPANASYTESGHQAYDEAVPAGHSPTDQQPPHHGSASGIHGVDSPVPSASVARHLVDEDMTADEIARLEEEERELDRQIQEAGRRRQ